VEDGSWDVYEYEPVGVPSPAPGESSHACASSSSSGSESYKPGQEFTAEAVKQGTTVIPGVKGTEAPGCVALLSSGESSQESAFLDASEGDGEGEHGKANTEAGAEVFFMTAAKLVKQDIDNVYDVYDAHECTNASPCFPEPAAEPAACNTEASCKPSPEPQPGIYGPPASATFNGPGNASPEVVPPPKKAAAKCKRGFVRRTVKSKHGKPKSECVRVKPKKRKAKR
jgi:hypothetical protein